MIDFEYKDSYGVYDLARVVEILRGPGGCPWDAEQTHQSIRRNFLEETYEVCEAIDEGSPEHLREELGDVLLQVLFHAQIEKEEERFNLDDVADGVTRKLIFRHPHVFGDVQVSGSEQVLTNWDELKRVEKNQARYADTVDSVARSLPSLWRAEKVQKKAKKAGFDWPDVSGAMDKLAEETDELRTAIREDSNVAEELGDLLFAAVNVARYAGVDPEDALHAACDKFSRRFRLVEDKAIAQGKDMKEMPLAELDKLWDEAKQDLKA